MVPTIEKAVGAEKQSRTREETLRAYRWMLLARLVDEKMASLYRRGGIIYGGVFLGRGQEALSVALGQSLRRGDIYAPLIRDGAGRLAFGETLFDGFRTYMGSPLGPMRGRDANVHRGRPKEGMLPMISHLGAMVSVVNGMLMAKRFQGVKGCVGGACVGDGATSTGSFHEALNQAAVEKLPVVVVVANNQFAYSTPTSSQFACRHLVDRAEGYGVTGHVLDGTDLFECLEVVGAAVESARAGRGPQLVVASLLRLCGHSEQDVASYIDASLKASPAGRDCIKVAEQSLIQRGWADAAAFEKLRDGFHEQIEDAVATVQREAPPDPYREQWTALSTEHLREGPPISAAE